MPEHSLNQWVIRSQKGDEAAFGQIVAAFQAQIFAYVFRLVGREQDAKDIVQDTFIKAWTSCASYRAEYRFSTWLYKIATNCCYDYLTKNKRVTTVPEETMIALLDQVKSTDLEQQLTNRQLAAIIGQLTQQLTPKQKLVFTLKYLEGLDTEEITLITKLSADKVKSNLYLAKKEIKNALRKTIDYEKR